MTRMTACLLILTLGSALAAGPQQPRGDAVTIATFQRLVQDYADLRARVAATLPPRPATMSAAELLASIGALRWRMRAERRHAKQGDFFFAQVRPILKDIIEVALRDGGIDPEELVEIMRDDTTTNARRVEINKPFPWERGTAMAPCLLAALPKLPLNVEYRLDRRNLVLVDVETDLVLDILPHALAGR